MTPTRFYAKSTAKASELYVYDYIGGDFFGEGITAQSVTDAMKDFKPKSDLNIYINSPGGDVFEGITIGNIIKRWEGKRRVYVDGIAASIASVVAMSCDERHIAADGMMMIHLPWGFSMGTADDMRKTADALDKVRDVILSTYVAATNGDEKKIKKWMEDETWMNADECVERGFCTTKMEQRALKAEFPMLAKFKNTPDTLRRAATDMRVLLARMDMRAARFTNRGPVPAGAGR